MAAVVRAEVLATFAYRILLACESTPKDFRFANKLHDMKSRDGVGESKFEYGACLAALLQLSVSKFSAQSLQAVAKLLYRSICTGLHFKRSFEVIKIFETLGKIHDSCPSDAKNLLSLAAGAAVNCCRALLESFERTERSEYLWKLAYHAKRAAHRIQKLGRMHKCSDNYLDLLRAVLCRTGVDHAHNHKNEDARNAMLECAKCGAFAWHRASSEKCLEALWIASTLVDACTEGAEIAHFLGSCHADKDATHYREHHGDESVADKATMAQATSQCRWLLTHGPLRARQAWRVLSRFGRNEATIEALVVAAACAGDLEAATDYAFEATIRRKKRSHVADSMLMLRQLRAHVAPFVHEGGSYSIKLLSEALLTLFVRRVAAISIVRMQDPTLSTKMCNSGATTELCHNICTELLCDAQPQQLATACAAFSDCLYAVLAMRKHVPLNEVCKALTSNVLDKQECILFAAKGTCAAAMSDLRLEPFLSRLILYDCALRPEAGSYFMSTKLYLNCWGAPLQSNECLLELLFSELESIVVRSSRIDLQSNLAVLGGRKLLRSRTCVSVAAELTSTLTLTPLSTTSEKPESVSCLPRCHGCDRASVVKSISQKGRCELCAAPVGRVHYYSCGNVTQPKARIKRLKQHNGQPTWATTLPLVDPYSWLNQVVSCQHDYRYESRLFIRRWFGFGFFRIVRSARSANPLLKYHEAHRQSPHATAVEELFEAPSVSNLRSNLTRLLSGLDDRSQAYWQVSEDLVGSANAEPCLIREYGQSIELSLPVPKLRCFLACDTASRVSYAIRLLELRAGVAMDARSTVVGVKRSSDCELHLRCAAVQLRSAPTKQSSRYFVAGLVCYEKLLVLIRPSYRDSFRSLRWLLTGDTLRKQGRFQASQRAYSLVNVIALLDIDRGWSVDALLGLGRVASLLGDSAIAQIYYKRALAVPTPVPVLASGFAESAVAYYRLGRLALDGRLDQVQLHVSAIIANFAQAAAMAHCAGLVKLHQNVMRTLSVVCYNFGVPDNILAVLLHASFFCQLGIHIQEWDRQLGSISTTDIQVLGQILMDFAHDLNADQADASLSRTSEASANWLHPNRFKFHWVLIATCISPSGHIVICRSVIANHVIYCSQLAAHWPAVIQHSMSSLTGERMQQAMMALVSHDSQHCKKVFPGERRRDWWRSRHTLEIELRDILQQLYLHFDDGVQLLCPRLISRDKQLAKDDAKDSSIVHDNDRQGKRKSSCARNVETSCATRVVVTIGAAKKNVSDLSTTQLCDQLRRLGLSTTGKKVELVDRLSAEILDTMRTTQAAQTPDRACRRIAPVILVLDAVLQEFPIEALPCLALIPTSRIPHIGLAASLRDNLVASDPKGSGTEDRSCTFVVDPAHNLVPTRKTIVQKLEHHPWTWSGVSGVMPTPLLMSHALEFSDVVLFCGHGNGRCYLLSGSASVDVLVPCTRTCSTMHGYHSRRSRIVSPGAILLMGCASGNRRQSDALILALLFGYNCRNVVATLWDVTDRDIDRLTLDVLFRWAQHSGFSTSDALALARQTCKLPLLNGGATVCYGLP
mmetsp:Transcript_22082/g.67952  ORF Transcript_22082/g.67952 Transcript_22082/m.67952 type:complete len:1552 (+) Transcript_22082:374-5029(+)